MVTIEKRLETCFFFAEQVHHCKGYLNACQNFQNDSLRITKKSWSWIYAKSCEDNLLKKDQTFFKS